MKELIARLIDAARLSMSARRATDEVTDAINKALAHIEEPKGDFVAAVTRRVRGKI